MKPSSAQLALAFSSIGHSFVHLFAGFYFIIVVSLEDAWNLPYADLVELWTLGALMIGLAALPAGWLGDRWSPAGMMALMFIGMGLASITCGLIDGPTALLVGLTALGLFAAIYHPVGIAWVVRNAKSRGKALGINGIFGGMGVASSGLVAGSLIDLYSWRAAFIVPGVVSLVIGLALVFCLLKGWMVEEKRVQASDNEHHSRADRFRAFFLLMFCMFCIGLVFQATQTALPKLFDLRLKSFVGEGLFGVGALVAAVYGFGAIMQVVGGHLADRYNVKYIYLFGLFFQVPCLFFIAYGLGVPLVFAAMGAVLLNSSALPAENMLLARFTPQHRHGLAYGMKFVLAFSAGPLAVQIVSFIQGRTGEFTQLFIFSGCVMLLAFLAANFIPNRRQTGGSTTQPQPAE
ncbi:MFS transporter [Limibacillus sp. MBR-115]|jgi:MFS family permease|uniref:MFS transporter n=1 Tax=Limibacillus sp. MBR-115 TaxID=3156465 RepID=UPI003399F5C0